MDMNLSKLREMVDRRAWCTVHRVTKSQTWLSDWKISNNQLTFHKKMNLDDLGGSRMQSQRSLYTEKGGKRGSVRMIRIKRSNWPLLSLKIGEDSHEPRNVGNLSVQFSSVRSCLTLCIPMNCSTPGLPVHHQLPEFTQTQRPSSQWCHPAISSSVVPFSSCPQSLPESESFQMSQLFAWGGQSTNAF